MNQKDVLDILSGFPGHAGRPGEQGGSLPREGSGYSSTEMKKMHDVAGLMKDNPAIPTPKPILSVLDRWGFDQSKDEPSVNGPINVWRDGSGAKIEINPRDGQGDAWSYAGPGKEYSFGKGAKTLADYLLRHEDPHTRQYFNPEHSMAAQISGEPYLGLDPELQLEELMAGGPGSKCNPDKGPCGRRPGASGVKNPDALLKAAEKLYVQRFGDHVGFNMMMSREIRDAYPSKWPQGWSGLTRGQKTIIAKRCHAKAQDRVRASKKTRRY